MLMNMLFQLTQSGIVVVAHDGRKPRPESWEDYLGMCRANAEKIRGFIVFTQGGRPDARMRRAGQDLWRSLGRAAPPPTAVVSESLLVRGVQALRAWLGASDAKAFRAKQAGAALDYLQVT